MPIVVVSDTSPIRALHHLKLLHLCRDLYGKVIVPQAVVTELRTPTLTCPPIDLAAYPGFEVHTLSDLSGVAPELDPGETEAIALALELRADLLLVDERKATEAARNAGLQTLGVVGILLEAKRAGLIERVLPLIELLVKELNFFISESFRRKVAQLSAE